LNKFSSLERRNYPVINEFVTLLGCRQVHAIRRLEDARCFVYLAIPLSSTF
jgi:hypothetical protein